MSFLERKNPATGAAGFPQGAGALAGTRYLCLAGLSKVWQPLAGAVQRKSNQVHQTYNVPPGANPLPQFPTTEGSDPERHRGWAEVPPNDKCGATGEGPSTYDPGRQASARHTPHTGSPSKIIRSFRAPPGPFRDSVNGAVEPMLRCTPGTGQHSFSTIFRSRYKPQTGGAL